MALPLGSLWYAAPVMAKKGKTAVLKRQREVRKAEKAALKREQRDQRAQTKGSHSHVATRDDLAGYGLADEDEDQPEDASSDPPSSS